MAGVFEGFTVVELADRRNQFAGKLLSESGARVEHANEVLTRIRQSDFARAEGAISSRLTGPIRDILLSLAWWYPDDYDILQILAEGDATFVREYLAENPAALAQYARFSLIDTSSGRFRIEPIRDFLLSHGEEYKRMLSPFARSDVELGMLPEWVDFSLPGIRAYGCFAAGHVFQKLSDTPRSRSDQLVDVLAELGWVGLGAFSGRR